ncbi:MAG: magnesium transporter [Chlamydiae bacterium CG10_big_fil_rev_8_21_14_0_10_42_34]|nr:MAG: magnesium transporter [Chlamydiae bacterium CG10_big_fil_rev_8_21_14_0_10_42_34]
MEEQEAESQTGRIDDLLKEKLEKAFHKQTSKVRLHDIAKIACEHSPIDLAYAASHLPPNVRPVLYENLPNRDDKVKFIVNTDSDTRLALFRQLGDIELKKLFERMPVDEAVWLVDDMPERKFRRLMDLIDSKKANRIRELKQHDRKSAGRLMTSEFFAFKMDMTIGEASNYIRDNPRIDFTKGIFILNHAHELQGFVPARNMMINPDTTPLRQVMRPVLHKVTVDATREEVIDLVERYRISSLPVVDIDNELIGVIAHEDIVEAMEDLTDETIARMAGTNEKFTSHDPIMRRFLTRAPWLLVTLAAGLLNVGVMSSFEKYEGGLLTFALFFVPLITGMSGTIGLQCSTVLVRIMAVGGLSAGNRKETITKELYSGLFTGVIFGIGCGLIIYLLDLISGGALGSTTPIAVSAIVSIGLIGGCFAGTFLGVFSPLFFMRIGVDPAISAGPVVTAFNDFLSMTIYFVIAWGVSTLFF